MLRKRKDTATFGEKYPVTVERGLGEWCAEEVFGHQINGDEDHEEYHRGHYTNDVLHGRSLRNILSPL